MSESAQRTPDGRYLIVRGRLWRTSNPNLPEAARQELVNELMSARRAKGVGLCASNHEQIEAAKARVQAAKEGLGERGGVWWEDDAPDENRKMAHNSSYSAWWAQLNAEQPTAEK